MTAFVHLRRQISDLAISGKGFVRGDGIRQNQNVFILLIFEVVVDAFLFQQAVDKIQGRFPILHAIFARRIGFGKPNLEIAEPVFPKNPLNDMGNTDILINAAIRRAAEKP